MVSPVKSVAQTLLSLQSIASALLTVGPTVDVSGKFGGTAYIHFGRTVATALSNAMRFRLEASAVAAADGEWFPLYEWQNADIAAAISTSATAGAAGAKSITVTNTSMAVRDKIFAKNGTFANSEFARIVTLVSTTGITVEDNLVNAQTTSVITTKAEMWAIPLDFVGVGRVRLIVDSLGPTGVACGVEGLLTTTDALS